MLPLSLLFLIYVFIYYCLILISIKPKGEKQIDTWAFRNPCVLKMILQTVGTAAIVNFLKSLAENVKSGPHMCSLALFPLTFCLCSTSKLNNDLQ